MEAKDTHSDYEYEDSENFKGSGDGLQSRDIILNLFRKALQEGSKEMTQGGVFKRYVNDEIVEVAVPNQREIFINSVQMLRTALNKKIKDNKIVDLRNKFTNVDTKINTIEKDYNESLNKIQSDLMKRQHAKLSTLRQQAVYDFNNSLKMIENNKEIRLVSAYKELLTTISFLLDELNYLGEGGISG